MEGLSLYQLPNYRPWWESLFSFAVMMVFLLLGFSAATQYVASAMEFSPALGEPVIGRFYAPWDFFVWLIRYRAAGNITGIFMTGGAICGGIILLGTAITTLMSWNARKTLAVTHLHGSARWGDTEDVEKTGLVSEQGVFLGEWRDEKRYHNGAFLRHDGPEHILIFAPTRSGKGVGFVVPTLLEWQHSAVIVDIKGENWALTAGWRASKGQKVIKFEPQSADGTTARWNPLMEIRLGDNEVRDAQNIADILVDPDGDGELDHWQKGARTLLTAAILHVLYTRPEKNLREVALLLSDPTTPFDLTLEKMLTARHDDNGSRGWKNPDGSACHTHPAIQATARELLNKSEKERSSMVSSAVNCLGIFRDDPVLARNTAASDFLVRDLMHHETPVSLYLVIAPSDLSRLRVLMRLILSLTGRKLTEKLGDYRHRLLMLLDEFPALGRLEFFQDAIAYLAGYGIKAMLITQNLSQLYLAYGERQSITANCHIRVALTPNDLETAKQISDISGIQTVLKHSRNISGKRGSWMLSNISEGLTETQRPLITQDEAMRLPADKEILFIGGHTAILALRVRYYENAGFVKRSTIEAPKDSQRIVRSVAQMGFPTIAQVSLASSLPDTEEVKTLPPFAIIQESEEEEDGAVAEETTSKPLVSEFRL